MRRRRINRADESIAPARHGLDIARRLGLILQRDPQLAHRRVQPRVEVDNARWPQTNDQLLACHQLAGSAQQLIENLQRLILQADLAAVLGKFAQINAQHPAV
ncbi:MAG TPA: hypothetical protein VJ303_03790, partial [Steroidobacteraceae bacterium]|nr:hypothetical protein [Steroidobacteraceae bacterium]